MGVDVVSSKWSALNRISNKPCEAFGVKKKEEGREGVSLTYAAAGYNVSTRMTIDDKWKGGRLDASHDKIDPVLSKAQSQHYILKKGHSTLSKALDMSSLTAMEPSTVVSPRMAWSTLYAIRILSEMSFPLVNAPCVSDMIDGSRGFK